MHFLLIVALLFIAGMLIPTMNSARIWMGGYLLLVVMLSGEVLFQKGVIYAFFLYTLYMLMLFGGVLLTAVVIKDRGGFLA